MDAITYAGVDLHKDSMTIAVTDSTRTMKLTLRLYLRNELIKLPISFLSFLHLFMLRILKAPEISGKNNLLAEFIRLNHIFGLNN